MVRTSWGDGYIEMDKGRFEAVIVKDGREVCFSRGDELCVGKDYKAEDLTIALEFADLYELDCSCLTE